jgi:pimeloyl-ACP methyl ester carboxylesterase
MRFHGILAVAVCSVALSVQAETVGCANAVALRASRSVYDVYRDFRARPGAYRQDPNHPGVFFPSSSDGHLALPGYALQFVLNGRAIRSGNLFAAHYEPLDGGRPLLSFKGSTDNADWLSNIFDRGAGHLQRLVNDLVGSLAADDGVDSRLSELAVFFREHYGERGALLTGHSLGGALAQNFGALIAAVNPDNEFEIVTFNSLAGSTTFGRLYEKNRRLYDRLSLRPGHIELSNVTTRNFFTTDDPVAALNLILKATNIGSSYVLPSEDVFPRSRYRARSPKRAHGASSLRADMRYGQDLPRSLSEMRILVRSMSPHESEMKLRLQRSRIPVHRGAPNPRDTEAALFLDTLERARAMLVTLESEGRPMGESCGDLLKD